MHLKSSLLLFSPVVLTTLLSCSSGSGTGGPISQGGEAGQSGDDGGASTGGTGGSSTAELDRVDGEFPVGLAEGLAPTPPMGWNSWNRFGCNTSAEQIMGMADAMVESGMKDAGYEYVNIDDCWLEAERTDDGEPMPTERFPDGMKPVADYVHDLGLKLGIYSDRGDTTCAFRAGSRDHVAQDAKLYAEWGIDYLKYDNCDYIDTGTYEHNLDEALMKSEFTMMSEALKESGRDIVLSVCAWRFYEWAVPLGQLWRTTGDIEDEWGSITGNININGRRLAAYAGPNHWNDPDMLEVGNGGMTADEYRAHFGMWSMMAAPLIAGNDLRTMDKETMEILTNTEVIAVDQDALGLQGVSVWSDDDTSVWVKPLDEHGARAVALLNEGDEEREIGFSLETAWLRSGKSATLRDLWKHADRGTIQDDYATMVGPHAMVLLKVLGEEPELPRGETELSSLNWVYAANAAGPVERDQSNGATKHNDGSTISIAGTEFDTGLGVAAASLVTYRLGRRCSRFRAMAGVDDQTKGSGSVAFEVWGDRKHLFQSDVVNGGDEPVEIDVDVSGVYRLELKVTNGLDGTAQDYASWADARLDCED